MVRCRFRCPFYLRTGIHRASATRLSNDATIPLRTLDSEAAFEDLAWLDEAIGDVQVVALGESTHDNRESYLLRHRLA